MQFHFITVVWGKLYTQLYVEFFLPTQLAAGNLPAFANQQESVYKIYTTPADAELILKSPVYQAVAAIMPIQVVTFNLDTNLFKYQIMNCCHQHAVIAANQQQAILVFLMPDMVWADGAFGRMIPLAEVGKRLVIASSLRVTRESFIPAFRRKFHQPGNPVMTVNARDLAQIMLEHLHPVTEALFWNSPIGNKWPSHLCWRVADQGVLVRSFHAHALMVNPRFRHAIPLITFDDEYVSRVCPDVADIYVVKDSDEMLYCEVTSLSGSQGWTLDAETPLTLSGVAEWAQRYASPFHHHFFSTKMRIHAVPLDHHHHQWQEAEQASDQVAEAIYNYLKQPV